MIGIIHYEMGNIASVKNACDFLNLPAKIIKDPNDLESVTHMILPGVGSFSDGVKNLQSSGFFEAIKKKVLEGIPLLGICLGMQLLATYGEEGGKTSGFGFIPGRVIKFSKTELRVPHIGWNNISIVKENKIIDNENSLDFYFVHSYYLEPENEDCVVAVCDYGIKFASVVQNDNVFGVQFHPEKSFHSGFQILKNFYSV